MVLLIKFAKTIQFQSIQILHIVNKSSQKTQKSQILFVQTHSHQTKQQQIKVDRQTFKFFFKDIKKLQNFKKYQKIDKCYIELIQLRRLLRINRILAYFKQFLPLLKRTQKNWLDYFNIIFKNLLFVLDINDLIGYLQQLNLIGKNTINPFDIKKRTANLYFFQCLMWLFLNVHDFFKNKNKRTHSQNLRKQLTILKYFLDSFTSYNDFSRRYYTLDTKITTFIGTISSIVGLYTLWV